MSKVKPDKPAVAADKGTAAAKSPGRNELVTSFTQNGSATFVFDEPMVTTGEFTSYNGGKGQHGFNVVRNDGVKGKSGKTGLKYLLHTSGKTLFDLLAEQSKRGRPKKEEPDTPVEGAPEAATPAAPGDAFDFLDKKVTPA